MIKNEFNGWTNKQTWSINLRYEEIFHDLCKEQIYMDVYHMADSFDSLVEELEFEGLQENSLAYEAVGYFLNEVNWEEIAGEYSREFNLF